MKNLVSTFVVTLMLSYSYGQGIELQNLEEIFITHSEDVVEYQTLNSLINKPLTYNEIGIRKQAQSYRIDSDQIFELQENCVTKSFKALENDYKGLFILGESFVSWQKEVLSMKFTN